MFYSKELKVLMLKQVACLGAPLTYFTDGEGGGVRVTFLGMKFWPKGISLVYERHRDFLGCKKHLFFGIVVFISSNQQ